MSDKQSTKRSKPRSRRKPKSRSKSKSKRASASNSRRKSSSRIQDKHSKPGSKNGSTSLLNEWFPNICAREWTPEKQWAHPAGPSIAGWVQALQTPDIHTTSAAVKEPRDEPDDAKNDRSKFPEEVFDICDQLVQRIVDADARRKKRKKIKRLQEKWQNRAREEPLEDAPAAKEIKPRVDPSPGDAYPRGKGSVMVESRMTQAVRIGRQVEEETSVEDFIDAVQREDFKWLLRWYNKCISQGLDVRKSLNRIEDISGRVLLSALEVKSPDLVSMLLKWGLRLHRSVEVSKVNPLLLAVEAGNEQVAEALLRHMALSFSFAIDEKGSRNQTALHKACQKGNLALTKLLLDFGASATARDSSGSTALHLAVQSGAVDVVRVLLRGKVKISLEGVDKQSRTPLMLATVLGHAECAAELIQSGALPSSKMRAIDLVRNAVKHGRTEVVRLLIEKGAYVREVDGCPLQGEQQRWIAIAAIHGGVQMLELLMELSDEYGLGLFLQLVESPGALENLTSPFDPALRHAVEWGRWDVVSWLLHRKLYVGKYVVHVAFDKANRGKETTVPVAIFQEVVRAYLYEYGPKSEIHEAESKAAFLDSLFYDMFSLGWSSAVAHQIRRKIPYAKAALQLWPSSGLKGLGESIVNICCLPSTNASKFYPKASCKLWRCALKRQCSDSRDHVRVLLSSGVVLILNKSILACRCEYFKAMFSHKWQEKDSAAVDLREFDANSMCRLFEYLYNGEIEELESAMTEDFDVSDGEEESDHVLLFEQFWACFTHDTEFKASFRSLNVSIRLIAFVQLCLGLMDLSDYFLLSSTLLHDARNMLCRVLSKLAREGRLPIESAPLISYILSRIEICPGQALGPSALNQPNNFTSAVEDCHGAGESVGHSLQSRSINDILIGGYPGAICMLSNSMREYPSAYKSVIDDLHGLCGQEQFADCVLVSGDGSQLWLHSIILDSVAPLYRKFEVIDDSENGVRKLDISRLEISLESAKKLFEFCYAGESLLVRSYQEIVEILEASSQMGITNAAAHLFASTNGFSTAGMNFPYSGIDSISSKLLYNVEQAIYNSLVQDILNSATERSRIIQALLEEEPTAGEGFTSDITLAFYALLHARQCP